MKRWHLIILGLIFRMLGLYLYVQFINRDYNDMNEILMYGIQNMFSGVNPYSTNYQIAIWLPEDPRHMFSMFLGYPPAALLVYSPVMLFPELTGQMEIIIVFFVLNVFFDALLFCLIWDDKFPLKKAIAAFYWLFPAIYFMEYANYFSSFFLFVYLSLFFIEKPFLSGFFAVLSVLTYHLLVFYYFFLAFYQLKEFSHESPTPGKEGVLFIFKMSIRRRWKEIGKFIGASLLGGLILIGFLVWDFESTKWALFDASTARFRLGNRQNLFLGAVCLSSVLTFFWKSKFGAQTFLVFTNIAIYFIDTFIINYYYFIAAPGEPRWFIAHYFMLMLPFALWIPELRKQYLSKYPDQHAKP